MDTRTDRLLTPDQKNDATCIGNKRGMARRAKRHTAKRRRQRTRKEMIQSQV